MIVIASHSGIVIGKPRTRNLRPEVEGNFEGEEVDMQ